MFMTQAPFEEFCRNVYAVLAKVKPFAAGWPAGLKRKQPSEDSISDSEEPAQTSWCGALERGTVRSVHTKEGSKHLRKRRKLADDTVSLSK